MRHIRVVPDIEAHLVADPRPKRKHPNIPGMHSDHAPHSKHSDDFVVDMILRNLRGESMAVLARDTGLHEITIRNWCQGINRRKCYELAQAIYRKSLGVKQ